jgi:hypothetical protein
MGVSGQRHAPAALLPQGKGPLVPIVQEAGCPSGQISYVVKCKLQILYFKECILLNVDFCIMFFNKF